MSADRLHLRITSRAQRDLRHIRLYSLKQWGLAQADRYQETLSRGFELLLDNPHLGAARDDLLPGVRRLLVEEHRMLYRIKSDTIRVLRIVHVRQDLSQQIIGS